MVRPKTRSLQPPPVSPGEERRVQGRTAWPECARHSGLAVGTQDKAMHSRDTGPALCDTHTPPKGLQLLFNSVCSSPWPETPPPVFSGVSAHIRPKGRRRCRRPLFLRDWIGCHTPPGVVWGPGKTGETGAETAGQ